MILQRGHTDSHPAAYRDSLCAHVHSAPTGAKEGWKLGWQTLVRELAPQDKSGAYVRQSYSFVTRESDIKVWGVEGGAHKV